ncbi:hypothetical protein [Streptomyces sp. NPDC002403]
MTNPSGRALLGAAIGGAVAATAGLPATAHTASRKLRWSPSAGSGGLDAFETVEDDRADSHPAGRPHILAEGDNFRFNMHTADRDTSTDRRHQEVTGLRTVGDGASDAVRWILKDGATTVVGRSKSGVDALLADRVRPEWGIYRPLGDTSGSLQDAHLLLTGMRGYQLV